MRAGLGSMLFVFAVVCPVFAQPTAVFDTVFYSDPHGSGIATLVG